MTRDIILQTLTDCFSGDADVRAMWLEGADGLGRADAYSDLDLWFDVRDGEEQRILDTCEHCLSALAPLDLVDQCHHPHPKIFQRNFHLSGTSEFLLLDVCVQSHSRCTDCNHEGTTYTRGDIAELPLILFDHDGVIAFRDPEPLDLTALTDCMHRCLNTFDQRSRAVKYIRRGKYLEAHAYYLKYVCDPLLTLARIRYTPRHIEYGPVHVSDHLPLMLIQRLKHLYQTASLADIARNITDAERLCRELAEEVRIWLSSQ